MPVVAAGQKEAGTNALVAGSAVFGAVTSDRLDLPMKFTVFNTLNRNRQSQLQVIEAGANALVAGSAVFGAKDYAEAIQGIKKSKAPAGKQLQHA